MAMASGKPENGVVRLLLEVRTVALTNLGLLRVRQSPRGRYLEGPDGDLQPDASTTCNAFDHNSTIIRAACLRGLAFRTCFPIRAS